LKVEVRSELVCNELCSQELRDAQNLSAGYTHEERDRVHNVPKNELKSELVNTESMTDPGQQAVDSSDERQNGQDIRP